MQPTIIVYGTPDCPKVLPAIDLLLKARVHFEYVNILENPTARQYVQAVNKGYESVPTLVFPDGSTLTEPSRSTLKLKLADLGCPVPQPLWVQKIRRLHNLFR